MSQRIITVCRKGTGEVVRTYQVPRKVLHKIEQRYPSDDYIIVEGRPFDTDCKYVDGAFVKDEGKELREQWEYLRRVRDNALQKTDYVLLEDFAGDTAAWKRYRQELRDLPSNTQDPRSPQWPKMPER